MPSQRVRGLTQSEFRAMTRRCRERDGFHIGQGVLDKACELLFAWRA